MYINVLIINGDKIFGTWRKYWTDKRLPNVTKLHSSKEYQDLVMFFINKRIMMFVGENAL